MTDQSQDQTFSSGPSQAEGDRETVEQALGERPTQTSEQTGAEDQDAPSDLPSQAEGEDDASSGS